MLVGGVLSTLLLLGGAAAGPVSETDLVDDANKVLRAWRRATAQSPNGYTPSAVDCPSNRPFIRSGRTGLSPQEAAWLPIRRNNTLQPMKDLLSKLNIAGFDANSYINSQKPANIPNIAIAASGGGYRALLNGAGAFAAFDNRTANPTPLGGLLQAATYVAGLSGGSWLMGSIYVNNFTSIQALLDSTPDTGGSLWQFQNSIFEGPAKGGIQLLSSLQYYDDIYDQVQGKRNAGYDTSITDYWGRALSYQLVNATNGGPAFTWSSIAQDPAFSQGLAPLPFVVADGRQPGSIIISSNATVFEFTPWEMGSYDPDLYGFAPLKYVGANFSGGVLPQNESCINGFDNVGFVMGTSSSLFNQFFLQINSTSGVPTLLKNALGRVLAAFSSADDDIADWTPNPFYGYRPETNVQANSRRLTLVDGGEDLQNIPLDPLIQPIRAVDVIFAIDSSADNNFNWPNATALRATYERSLNATIQNGTAFPAIPDDNTFINLGLNKRPTFFGCNAANQTGPSPLIVYLPNAPYSYYSNVSTFDPKYNRTERNAIVQNGIDVATMGNGTVDSTWPSCVGCAILSRSWYRTNATVPAACTACFTRFCWNGTLATTPMNNMNSYQPTLILNSTTRAATGVSGGGTGNKKNAAGPRASGGVSLGLAVCAAALAALLV